MRRRRGEVTSGLPGSSSPPSVLRLRASRYAQHERNQTRSAHRLWSEVKSTGGERNQTRSAHRLWSEGKSRGGERNQIRSAPPERSEAESKGERRGPRSGPAPPP